ncbi:MAG: hypothetical protein R2847_01440 [Bacteroidia bacterium]
MCFGADAPSKGYEYLGQLTWAPTRQFSVYVRARSKTKEMNTGEAAVADYLVNRTQNNYRLNLSYKIIAGGNHTQQGRVGEG